MRSSGPRPTGDWRRPSSRPEGTLQTAIQEVVVMWRCLAGRRARARVTGAAGCVLAASAATSGLGVSPAAAAAAVQGLDVSSHQISTDWASAASGGTQFAYVKA